MDEDCPQTLLKFNDCFCKEEACLKYLSQLSWLKGFIDWVQQFMIMILMHRIQKW